ncbi:MAG TPA: metallophosphoesterase family protein, partial [Candidatus Sulfotelmatobacter sp.]|nr:metallophosphoesterase family protein [Candidatus Sulfotelmatobacter sp.]
MSIMWESLSDSTGVVRFGAGDTLDRLVKEIKPQRMRSTTNTFFLYEAKLKRLKPGATYSYSVELDGCQSALRQFRTLDPKAERVQFIAYGDTRSTPSIHSAIAKRFLEYSPEFILHTGDLVARGKDYNLWSREFFNPLAEVIDRVALFSVMGNHEEDGTNYLSYFHLPGKELWYSLDAGPVHVLALDFRFAKNKDEQFRFARRDLLASRAPWKIVLIHTPLFNIGGHASNWGHTNYLPLFRETQVDLVVAGHSHMYERFRPLAPASQTNAWAITHVTSGGGGANLHTALGHPALAIQETTNHFMVFDVSRDVLQAKAIRVDGALLDSFEIKKTEGRPTADYLAQVYPEELMNLFYEVGPSLGGRVANLPARGKPTEVMLTVLPRGKTAAPAELEIGLAPESALAYELVDGPLHVTTPPWGQTNTVWAQVQVRDGKKITQNKSSELEPSL